MNLYSFKKELFLTESRFTTHQNTDSILKKLPVNKDLNKIKNAFKIKYLL